MYIEVFDWLQSALFALLIDFCRSIILWRAFRLTEETEINNKLKFPASFAMKIKLNERCFVMFLVWCVKKNSSLFFFSVN